MGHAYDFTGMVIDFNDLERTVLPVLSPEVGCKAPPLPGPREPYGYFPSICCCVEYNLFKSQVLNFLVGKQFSYVFVRRPLEKIKTVRVGRGLVLGWVVWQVCHWDSTRL